MSKVIEHTVESAAVNFTQPSKLDKIISAGSKEKAFMFVGLKAGTVLGEVVRFFWQFKQYPTTFISKAIRAATIEKLPSTHQTGNPVVDFIKSLSRFNAVDASNPCNYYSWICFLVG